MAVMVRGIVEGIHRPRAPRPRRSGRRDAARGRSPLRDARWNPGHPLLGGLLEAAGERHGPRGVVRIVRREGDAARADGRAVGHGRERPISRRSGLPLPPSITSTRRPGPPRPSRRDTVPAPTTTFPAPNLRSSAARTDGIPQPASGATLSESVRGGAPSARKSGMNCMADMRGRTQQVRHRMAMPAGRAGRPTPPTAGWPARARSPREAAPPPGRSPCGAGAGTRAAARAAPAAPARRRRARPGSR